MWSGSSSSDSDPNKRWIYGGGIHGNHYQRRMGAELEAWAALEWKPGSRVSLRFEPQVERTGTSAQYVDTFDDPTATDTFGHRYVFADLDQTTVSASCAAQLDLHAASEPGGVRPAAVLLRTILPASRSWPGPGATHFNRYPGSGCDLRSRSSSCVDPDGAGPAAAHGDRRPRFHLASLRGNAVLRWEYSPGSTLFLVWTQNRSDNETIGTFRTGRALSRLVKRAPTTSSW